MNYKNIISRVTIFLGNQLGSNGRIPETHISVGNPEILNLNEFLLVIGGPIRNSLTERIISECNTYIDYSEEKGKFFIKKGRKQNKELNQSGNLSIIEKTMLNDQTVIIAYGYGEKHTRYAVEYLTDKWQKLYSKYKNKAFALCFIQELDGSIKIIEELSECL